jgi:hypothetical protein
VIVGRSCQQRASRACAGFWTGKFGGWIGDAAPLTPRGPAAAAGAPVARIGLRLRPPGRRFASRSTPWSRGSTRRGHCRGHAAGTGGTQARRLDDAEHRFGDLLAQGESVLPSGVLRRWSIASSGEGFSAAATAAPRNVRRAWDDAPHGPSRSSDRCPPRHRHSHCSRCPSHDLTPGTQWHACITIARVREESDLDVQWCGSRANACQLAGAINPAKLCLGPDRDPDSSAGECRPPLAAVQHSVQGLPRVDRGRNLGPCRRALVLAVRTRLSNR